MRLVETIYRFLGWSAAFSEKQSRTRANGIPFTWWLMFAFGVISVLGTYQVRESLVNGTKPAEISLSDVIMRGDMEDRYISTRGQFVLGGGLAMTEKGNSDKPRKLYIPFVNVTTRSAVYVEVDPDWAKKPADMDAHHVSGMVRKLDHDLKQELGNKTQRFADIPINTERMIVAGDRPARLWIWIPVAAVPGILTLLLLLAFLQRYVVFRRTAEPASDATAAEDKPQAAGVIRVTGRFSLGPKDRQRFHNMPAVIAELEGGMIGLVTQTDASISFMGTVTKERKGVWMIPIRSGTLGEPEFGRDYFGGGAWPAFRVWFIDDANGKKEWAILAFDSAAAMREARDALYHAAVT